MDHADTNNLCGDREFKLLDANNGDADLALSWITIIMKTDNVHPTPDLYNIRYMPRNNKGTYSLKIKVTSILYGYSSTSDAWTVTVAGECGLTLLSIPASASITSITYTIDGNSNPQTIALFAHEQNSNCKFTTEVPNISVQDGTAFSSYSSWLTLDSGALTLKVDSTDKTLQSKVYSFNYYGTVTKENTQVITSLSTAFTITIMQTDCSDGLNHLPAGIKPPYFGDSAPGVELKDDGTSKIYSMEDYGDKSSKFFAQAASFNLICGEAVITAKSGTLSWFVVTAD